MPRGKNYVNNNKGVTLRGNQKAMANMKMCEYGSGCTRPDCIYRHEDAPGGKSESVCLPFLAGTCTFSSSGCRKRHPDKEECARLLAKYKRTRCRFGDKCHTEGCLYMHPSDTLDQNEPFYVEPHNVAFPPLNGPSSSAPSAAAPKAYLNSAWKAAPPSLPRNTTATPHFPAPTWAPQAPQQQPQVNNNPPYMAPHTSQPQVNNNNSNYFASGVLFDPSLQHYGGEGTNNMSHGDNGGAAFNVHAKEFTPGNFMS